MILVWETQQPYQSTLECAADGIVVEGLTIRHYSKSVANNYGVFVRDGSARLSGCDVSSRSGVGIGVEGACAVIDGCDVHDCERHGIAIFGGAEDGASSDEPGPLSGGGGTCVTAVRGCSIRGNKGNGMLVRDGAAPTVEANRITGNREYGVQVQDSSGRYGPGNNTGGNGKGDISIQGYFEGKVLPALSGSVGKA